MRRNFVTARHGIQSALRVTRYALLLPFFAMGARAQTSLSAAVALALSNSPRIKLATDDLRHARAVVSETKDAFVPSVIANGGAGDSYGITLNVPTILTVNAQSLVYSSSQRFYLRASRLSLQAAQLALQDVREQVEEDTVVTYLSLDSAQRTEAALNAEYADAGALETIVQKRFDAGLENELELSGARRQVLGIRLAQLQLEDERAMLQEHLRGLTGQPAAALTTVAESIPVISVPSADAPAPRDAVQAAAMPATSGELAVAANAQARQQHALGDASYRWKPQVSFAAQYGRVSPINDVSDYYDLHGKYNVAFAGVQVQFPIFDKARRARSDEAKADAAHANDELQVSQLQHAEDRLRLIHSLTELTVRAQIAEVDLSIAEAQLKATIIQTTEGGNGGGPVLSPKEEQNARVQARQRYLSVLDARLQMQKAQITMLRMTGGLEAWLGLPSTIVATPKH